MGALIPKTFKYFNEPIVKKMYLCITDRMLFKNSISKKKRKKQKHTCLGL